MYIAIFAANGLWAGHGVDITVKVKEKPKKEETA